MVTMLGTSGEVRRHLEAGAAVDELGGEDGHRGDAVDADNLGPGGPSPGNGDNTPDWGRPGQRGLSRSN
jgi:hypothetical protein